VDRLLHELRSTLARLKAELELLVADGGLALDQPFDSLREAFSLVVALERDRQRGGSLILVLDDDARLAALTAKQLMRAGFAARSASNLDGLDHYDPNSTRALIDLTLLRNASKRQIAVVSRLHLIVMTGAVSPAARLEAQAYGARHVLLKPIDIEILDRLIDES
jgi:ActR/RegA family two-component response regulator